jgi:hypothetical protein
MDLNYLRRLLKLFDESTLTELTIEEEGVTVHLARSPHQRQHHSRQHRSRRHRRSPRHRHQ